MSEVSKRYKYTEKCYGCDNCLGIYNTCLSPYYDNYHLYPYIDFDNCVHKICFYCVKYILKCHHDVTDINSITCICCKGKIKRNRRLKEKVVKYCHCSDVFDKEEKTVCEKCNKQVLHYKKLKEHLEELNLIKIAKY